MSGNLIRNTIAFIAAIGVGSIITTLIEVDGSNKIALLEAALEQSTEKLSEITSEKNSLILEAKTQTKLIKHLEKSGGEATEKIDKLSKLVKEFQSNYLELIIIKDALVSQVTEQITIIDQLEKTGGEANEQIKILGELVKASKIKYSALNIKYDTAYASLVEERKTRETCEGYVLKVDTHAWLLKKVYALDELSGPVEVIRKRVNTLLGVDNHKFSEAISDWAKREDLYAPNECRGAPVHNAFMLEEFSNKKNSCFGKDCFNRSISSLKMDFTHYCSLK